MGLRPSKVDRGMDKRPFTRTSKRVHKREYIKGVPALRISRFETGRNLSNYDCIMSLAPKKEVQIRHNALEAGRVVATSYMRKKVTTQEYFIKVLVYPHQVLREHAQAAVAQADRFYDGMKKPFGRPVGRAARVKKGQPVLQVRTFKKFAPFAKEALRRVGSKIPTGYVIIEN